MLRIYLTGELCLMTGAALIGANRMPGRQGRLAFTYLVDRRADPVPRQELAEVLWPQQIPPAYEVALSAVISKLRALFDAAKIGRAALVSEAGCYQLLLPGSSWVDVETAVDSVHMAEGALLAGDHGAAYGPAVVACAILRRPFLPGADGPWIDERRRTLRVVQLRALDCLAQIHMWNGEHSLALRAAQEAIDLEPFRESGYRRLMLLHGKMGNGAESIRLYERLATLLASELQTTPGNETRAVLASIVSGP